jgi:hypothetical protein
MSMQEDMLRETCPEDLQEYKRRQEMERRRAAALSGQPTALLLFGPPLILCAGVVLVAALHHALGAPLGAEWAAEVWSLAKTAIIATTVYTPFAAYVRRNNEAAVRAWEYMPPPPVGKLTRGASAEYSPPSQGGRPTTGRQRALRQMTDDTDDRGRPPP